MILEDFIKSLQAKQPPSGLTPLLLSLWFDAKGDWESSHNIAQEINTKDGALIHAYLHRKEGDIWNADYWYRTAGEKRKDIALEEEWEDLVRRFIV